MFAAAYKMASQFTAPVIVSVRAYDGSVKCSLGAFVVLSSEGWAVTAAHVFNPLLLRQQHAKEIASLRAQEKDFHEDSNLSGSQKRKRLKKLHSDPNWITNVSFYWGQDGIQHQDVKPLPEGDLVAFRLQPFDPGAITAYPILKDPSDLAPGTSLCKLGFPFHEVKATFDESTSSFTLDPTALPVPRFPIEGIYTRDINIGQSKDGKYNLKLLETSTPGLRGQSGGPIFDTNGTVWGIQSRTHHLALGFSPKVNKNGREVEENQVLNVGWGVHPELLTEFLSDNGIRFQIPEY